MNDHDVQLMAKCNNGEINRREAEWLKSFGMRRKGMQMEDYEIKHIEVMRRLAPECMVLLKKNGDFPLEQKGRIALYGSDARMTVKGGTGSGDVNVRRYTTIEQGLERAGFTITTKDWLEAFAACHKKPGWSIQKSSKKGKGAPSVCHVFGNGGGHAAAGVRTAP